MKIPLADLESVLSLGIVRLPHRCGLRWHYRSRHSSLIEFSNQKFYDGHSASFPARTPIARELGLGFHFVECGLSPRRGRHNAVEAAAVARAVMQHAIEHPELSLGVGTLNQPQQQAIEDEIEHLADRNRRARREVHCPPRRQRAVLRQEPGEHPG